MTHLRDEEFVDLIDGTLPRDRAAHVETCAACRDQHDAMRTTLVEVQAVDVTEPSPLFWDHFPSRVSADVVARPTARGWWIVAVPGIAILLFAVTLWFVRNPHPVVPDHTIAQSPAEPLENPGDTSTGSEEAAWELVMAFADGLRWEDAHAAGIDVTPGSADDVALQLSPEEQSELSRLLAEALKESGA